VPESGAVHLFHLTRREGRGPDPKGVFLLVVQPKQGRSSRIDMSSVRSSVNSRSVGVNRGRCHRQIKRGTRSVSRPVPFQSHSIPTPCPLSHAIQVQVAGAGDGEARQLEGSTRPQQLPYRAG
jgi:hypothetical protein